MTIITTQRFAHSSTSSLVMSSLVSLLTVSKSSLRNDVRLSAEHLLVPFLLQSTIQNDLESFNHINTEFPGYINMPINGRTLLHLSCSRGDVDSVTLLLKIGASLHLRDKYENLCLWDALIGGHPEVCKLLVQVGAHFGEVDTKAILNWAFDQCLRGSNLELLKVCGFDFRSRSLNGSTCLHMVKIQ